MLISDNLSHTQLHSLILMNSLIRKRDNQESQATIWCPSTVSWSRLRVGLVGSKSAPSSWSCLELTQLAIWFMLYPTCCSTLNTAVRHFKMDNGFQWPKIRISTTRYAIQITFARTTQLWSGKWKNQATRLLKTGYGSSTWPVSQASSSVCSACSSSLARPWACWSFHP